MPRVSRLSGPVSGVIMALVLLLGALYTPCRAETVGVILTRDRPFDEQAQKALQKYVRSQGFGDRVRYIVQRPHPDPVAWSNASRKLIAAEVDAIVTYGGAATAAALRENSGIPVIYAGVYDSVARNIPRDEATGVCSRPSIAALLRYIRESIQGVKSLGVLYYTLDEDSRKQFDDIAELSKKYGFRLDPLRVRRQGDVGDAISQADVSALFITSSAFMSGVYSEVLRMAETKKIPSASLVYDPALFATYVLSPNPEEHGREAARKLLRLLKGVPLEDIPPSCASEVELVFNLAKARELGIRIPMDVVTEATRIIY
ncbi:MAG: ABC transporter substrate binding protein [Nitrospirota bacterium]|jgi:putative ABC transport system substrate-binding protein